MPFVRNAVAAAALGVLLSGPAAYVVPAAASAAPVLAPHRAVYDLRLDGRRAARGVDEVRGRILFETSGNRCEGFTTTFRQVVEMSMNGNRLVMDLRTSHFEEGDGRGFRFTSRSTHNGTTQMEAEGSATREADAVRVSVRRPRQVATQVDRTAIFPTEHLIRIIEAAREGRNVLEVKVYDGAETGEKLYNATAIIGRRMPPVEGIEDLAHDPKLAQLARWPVTISYFEVGRESADPLYSIAFELYENGVSRQLVLNYKDFSLRGDLASLAWQPETACTPN